MITRRDTLVLMGAAAAVATRGFGLLRPRTLDGYSWEELAALAGRIAAAGSNVLIDCGR